MDLKEFEKLVEKNNKMMNEKIITLFELDKVDERILTKEELDHLLPIIKTIIILEFSNTIFTQLEDKLKK